MKIEQRLITIIEVDQEEEELLRASVWHWYLKCDVPEHKQKLIDMFNVFTNGNNDDSR